MTRKLVYLTAGAGGMFCGSCMHDNSLAKAIGRHGWDVQLVPLYTPIRTDEEDVSVDRVFFGGINVYLQQKIPFFRHLPMWLDGVLDNPRLIRRVTSRAVETNAAVLGDLALSMLRGAGGNQRKEVRRLVRWLANDARPDVIVTSNLLIAGFLPELKRQHAIPTWVTLQGDDVFLNALPDADRQRCLEQIQRNNESVDGFLVHSHRYRDYMSDYFSIPREKIQVTPLGLDTRDFRDAVFEAPRVAEPDSPRTIGYFARVAPEKGIQHLITAFLTLKQDPTFQDVRLRIAGWLSPENREFAKQQWQRLNEAGLAEAFHYEGSVDRAEKLQFLRGVDLLSVPTDHEEPKGLFALESLAAGTPVVLPRRGALSEIVEASRGGLLFELDRPDEYVSALKHLLTDHNARAQLGQQGRQFVLAERNEEQMARNTIEMLDAVLRR